MFQPFNLLPLAVDSSLISIKLVNVVAATTGLLYFAAHDPLGLGPVVENFSARGHVRAWLILAKAGEAHVGLMEL
jgi:hypothetical protein